MVGITIILGALCIGCILYIVLLKRGMRQVRIAFEEAKDNIEGEQHILMAFPDKELEALAVVLNEYISKYHEERRDHRAVLSDMRHEITHISHDLRTPLTAILGYMTFIEVDNLPKEQQEAIQVITQRAEYLNELIETLYEYVRLENDEYTLRMQEVNLTRLLKEHLLSHYIVFEQHHIALAIDLGEDDKLLIEADPHGLERILQNLTSNALKYSGGSLKVSLIKKEQHIEITYRTYRGTLSDYDIAHLLDRYYKKVEPAKAIQSSGLGLAIVKTYATQMGGDVTLTGDADYLYITVNMQLATCKSV